MPTGQDRIGRYYSPHPHSHSPPKAGQPLQYFSSLEQMLRQNHIERSAAVLADFFIRKAVPNISERNPDFGGIEDFLMDVAPLRSAKYLVAELKHPESVNPVLRVLASYGASEHTVRPLIGALGDDEPAVVSAAKKALVGYGRDALGFIKTQNSGIPLHMQTPLYRQLTEVIAAIKSGQPGGVR